MALNIKRIITLLQCFTFVKLISAAVPASRSLSVNEPVYSSNAIRNTSVCWTDDVAYNNQDIVPGAGPCEQCVCNAPDIVCSVIKCEVKTGCKIIQKQNQCCPDFKCECEYNKRIYNNGEKIDTSDMPCRVCYCKGGDVMCTTIGCYEREDCEGKIIPGTCCPKYDHCPPLGSSNKNNRIKQTIANSITPRNGKQGLQPWLLTTDSANTADPLNELTTNNDMEYNIESTPLPEKALTMVLKRIVSQKDDIHTKTVHPEHEIHIDYANTERVTEQVFTTNPSNVVSEALNTIGTSTTIKSSDNLSSIENITVPYQKEALNLSQEVGVTNDSKCPLWSSSSSDTTIFTNLESTEKLEPPTILFEMQDSEIPPKDMNTFADVEKSTIDILQQLLNATMTTDKTESTISDGPEIKHLITESTQAMVTNNYLPENLTIRTMVIIAENETNKFSPSPLDDDEETAHVTLVEKQSQQIHNHSETNFIQTADMHTTEKNFNTTSKSGNDTTTNKISSFDNITTENTFFENANVTFIEKENNLNDSDENLKLIVTHVKVIEPVTNGVNVLNESVPDNISENVLNLENTSTAKIDDISSLNVTINRNSTNISEDEDFSNVIIKLITKETNISASWEDRGTISTYVRVVENNENGTDISYSEESKESIENESAEDYIKLIHFSEVDSQHNSSESLEIGINIKFSIPQNNISMTTESLELEILKNEFSKANFTEPDLYNVTKLATVVHSEIVNGTDIGIINKFENLVQPLRSDYTDSIASNISNNKVNQDELVKITAFEENLLNQTNEILKLNTSSFFQVSTTEYNVNSSNSSGNDFFNFETTEFSVQNTNESNRSESGVSVSDESVKDESKKFFSDSLPLTSSTVGNITSNFDFHSIVSSVTTPVFSTEYSEFSNQSTNENYKNNLNTLLNSTASTMVQNGTEGSYEVSTTFALSRDAGLAFNNVSESMILKETQNINSSSSNELMYTESTTIRINENDSVIRSKNETLLAEESTLGYLELGSKQPSSTLASGSDLFANKNNSWMESITVQSETEIIGHISHNITTDSKTPKIDFVTNSTNISSSVDYESDQNSNLTLVSIPPSTLFTATASKPLEMLTTNLFDTSNSSNPHSVSKITFSSKTDDLPSTTYSINTELFDETTPNFGLNSSSTFLHGNSSVDNLDSKPASTLDSSPESNFTEIFTQKFVAHPVKLINAVNSVYMSPGLGYREQAAFTNPYDEITNLMDNFTNSQNMTITESTQSNEMNGSQVEDNKSMDWIWHNISLTNYKILLNSLMDGKVKPLTKVPNVTVIPLTWLKGSISNVTNRETSTTTEIIPPSIIPNTSTESSKFRSNDEHNITETTTVVRTANNDSLKNESREEPAQAKVYDPLMPYPEEYPEEYQTIQNGPAIIITRTTYTRIPDVTYTTVTMATLPTYQQVQKAEEGFANTLFERKFHERSFPNGGSTDSTFAPVETTRQNENGSYFNIDVKKIDEDEDKWKSETHKNNKLASDRKLNNNTKKDNQKTNTNSSRRNVNMREEKDANIPALDENDMKIIQNFMNKNLRLR